MLRVVAVFAILDLAVAVGQTSLVRGALEGAVSDPSGARIPGAAITLRDNATHLTREVSSDAEGVFTARSAGGYVRG